MAFTCKLHTAVPSRTQVVAAAKFRPQSRIGKKPVPVPSGVTVNLKGSHLSVKGPKGELEHEFHPLVTVVQDGDVLKVTRNADTKEASALHGLSRALTNNMITGVSEGFVRELELRGVGYRAAVSGQELTMNLGYSHPVVMKLPDVVKANVQNNTLLTLESCDNELLGNLAAVIRSKRPPEPYKGKGIRYLNENVIQKAGKSG